MKAVHAVLPTLPPGLRADQRIEATLCLTAKEALEIKKAVGGRGKVRFGAPGNTVEFFIQEVCLMGIRDGRCIMRLVGRP